MTKTNMHLATDVPQLIDAWCERRALRCLRCVLPAWPHNGLTDGIAQLKTALEDVRAFGREELTPAESAQVAELINAMADALDRRG